MPIIATRDGELVSSKPITSEQQEQLWKTIFHNFIKSHPEVITEEKEDMRA